MIWVVIILIIIVGYFIIRAINNGTDTRLRIETQRRKDASDDRQRLAEEKQQALENSPEYKQQKSLNAHYAYYLFNVNLWKTLILEAKIRNYYFPESEERIDDGKKRIMTKRQLQEDNKKNIEGMRESLEQYEIEWQEAKDSHAGYSPDSVEQVMDEQGISDESTFLIGYEYYVWTLNHISSLQNDLSDLKKGIDIEAKHYKEAEHYIKTKMKSGDMLFSSTIQKVCYFGLTEAWRVYKKLQSDGVITSMDGARPSRVV